MPILCKLKPLRLLAALGFLSLMVPFQASALTDREEQCGKVHPVKAYTANVGGLNLRMDAHNKLSVNGKVIFNEAPEPWEDSANGARVAETGDNILVQTMITDCIDISVSRIYVLNKDGTLRTTSPLWTENWASGFANEAGDLIYWSEYFCLEDNKDRLAGKSYVYVLKKGAKSFVREDRPSDALCSEKAKTRLSASSIRFRGMKSL